MSFFSAVGVGVVIFALTALSLGTEKTKSLPGGAIGAGIMLDPWYMGVLGGLSGHLLCVGLIYLRVKYGR